MFFKPKAVPECVVTPVLAAPGLHLMHAEDSKLTFTNYVQTVFSNALRSQTGIISRTSAIVPYLTVRANIYIDGPEHDLFTLPPEMRNDAEFLDGKSNHLGQLQRLYVEFYRSVLAGKRYIIIADVFSTLSGPEARRFLTVANNTVKEHPISVIMLTEDQTLLDEFPEISTSYAESLLATTEAS